MLLPKRIKTIGEYAFAGTRVSGINIPATVTNGGTTYTVKSIGPSAFQGCYGLTRVVIPNSVQYIMNYAFLNCFNLPNITIPASVYTIYNQVFVGCSGLRSVICLRSAPGSWKDNIFDENTFSYVILSRTPSSIRIWVITGLQSLALHTVSQVTVEISLFPQR